MSAARDLPGVVQVEFGSEKTVWSRVLKRLRIDDYPVDQSMDLADLFKLVIDKKGEKGWVPTIIAEIDRGVSDGVVRSIAKQLKRLGSDTPYCRVILVLSDANAAFALPDDKGRQDFLWVEDFTEKETNEYFDERNFLMTEIPPPNATNPNTEKRKEIFEKIGTRPVMMNDVVSAGEENVDEKIKEMMSDAKDTMEKLLSYSDPIDRGVDFSQIVYALLEANEKQKVEILLYILKPPHAFFIKDNETIMGVPRSKFSSNTAVPEIVCKFLKEHHALLYHHPSKEYRFYSPAHFHAAVELKKETNLIKEKQ